MLPKQSRQAIISQDTILEPITRVVPPQQEYTCCVAVSD
jgi:hypothetical protein